MKHTKKLLSIFLSLCVLLSITAGLDFSSYALDNCISKLSQEKVIGFDRYTGNVGDSKFFLLDNEKTYYDMNGETLTNGVGIWIARWNDKDEISWAKQTYQLSSEYTELTGTFTIINEGNTKNFDTTVYFYDGENLIDSYNLSNKNFYKNINVDVIGVKELTILVKDNIAVSRGTNFALYNMFFDKNLNKTHNFSTKINKSTTDRNGSIIKICKNCGKTYTNRIYYPKTITLSSTSYAYNGKVKKPSVTVKDSKGKTISSKYYTVSYSSGRKNVGKYTVTIKFKGNYSGTVKKTFTIVPKSTTISKVTAGKKAFTAKWKKQSAATGYQIQYATDSKFTKNKKTVTVSKNKTTSKKISKLKAKKKYYVRIRTYKTVKVNGKNTKIYSGWSKAKTVKTK